MAVRSQRPQKTALAPWQAATLLPGARAADQVFAPLAEGEAPRIGILGDSGTGKTEAARRLVDEYVRRVPGVALVCDDKELRARFVGQERAAVADLTTQPPAAEPRVYVFRGVPSAGVLIDPETVCEMGWRLVARRRPVLIVYDELERAAEDGEWKDTPCPAAKWHRYARGACEACGKPEPCIPRAFAQGRALGLASLWGSQSPQDAPRKAFEQSSCILCFRLDGMGLNLLRRRGYVFEDDLQATIRSLPGDELPKPERGYFVLLRRGRPWDRAVYRFA